MSETDVENSDPFLSIATDAALLGEAREYVRFYGRTGRRDRIERLVWRTLRQLRERFGAPLECRVIDVVDALIYHCRALEVDPIGGLGYAKHCHTAKSNGPSYI